MMNRHVHFFHYEPGKPFNSSVGHAAGPRPLRRPVSPYGRAAVVPKIPVPHRLSQAKGTLRMTTPLDPSHEPQPSTGLGLPQTLKEWLVFVSGALAADTKPHRVSIQIDQNDPQVMNLVLNNTTNIIENPNGTVRRQTRRVCRWQDGAMVLRWAASAFLNAEKKFHRVSGYRELWMLENALKTLLIDHQPVAELASETRAA